MKLKTSLSLLALASCAALSTSALAQATGTLNITGNISPVNCTPSLTGGSVSGNTLGLQDAYIGDLDAAGKTAHETQFQFVLKGCTTSGSIGNMWVHFDGTNVDGSGRLNLTTAPSQATRNKLRFELLDAGTPIKAGLAAGAQPGTDQGTAVQFTGTNPNREATKTYSVRYYALAALDAGDIGAVATSVTYNVKYY